MSTEYNNWLKKNSKREVVAGIKVWACEGRLAHRLCEVISVKGNHALIQSVRGGARDWVDKNTLDTETEIE